MDNNADLPFGERKWARPGITVTNLGPHPIGRITEAVRGHLVETMGVPVIVSNGLNSYAVLAPANKSLKILCAGCFTPDCSLHSDTKCRKVSSHCQHLTTQRKAKFPCIALTTKDGLNAVHERNKQAGVVDDDFAPKENNNHGNHGKVCDLESMATEDLFNELRRRNELDEVVNHVDSSIIAQKAKQFGIRLLFDARPDDLRHELRRVTDGLRPSIESYYWEDKVPGMPHCSDRLDAYETRSKRTKPTW